MDVEQAVQIPLRSNKNHYLLKIKNKKNTMAYNQKGRYGRSGSSSQYADANEYRGRYGRNENDAERDRDFEDVYDESDYGRDEEYGETGTGRSRGYQNQWDRNRNESYDANRMENQGRNTYGRRTGYEGPQGYGTGRQGEENQRPYYGEDYQNQNEMESEYRTREESAYGNRQGRQRQGIRRQGFQDRTTPGERSTGTRSQSGIRSSHGTERRYGSSGQIGYGVGRYGRTSVIGRDEDFGRETSEYDEDVYGQDQYESGLGYSGTSRAGYSGDQRRFQERSQGWTAGRTGNEGSTPSRRRNKRVSANQGRRTIRRSRQNEN